VRARLTNGKEIYPHREDLMDVPKWMCDECENHVGCHPNSIKPLGCIPTRELSRKRRIVHSLLDPLWRKGRLKRADIYSRLSAGIGRTYHTGELKSIEEADLVIELLKVMSR
jgi:hypothetical protein